MKKRKALTPLAFLAVLVLLTGSTVILAGDLARMHSPVPRLVNAPHGLLPQIVHHARAETIDAYRAALKSPDVLAAVPCTCGCVASLGHESNLDCYIDEVYPHGVVAYSTHGLDCYICQVITRDAVAGAAAGMTREELHQMILDRYSHGS